MSFTCEGDRCPVSLVSHGLEPFSLKQTLKTLKVIEGLSKVPFQ